VTFDAGYAENHPGIAILPGEHVAMIVSDTGHGMDRTTMDHIFEPFFTTKGVGRGTGLGLATVYGIVKQLGGYVWAYSEPGRGTAMKVYLPAAAAAVSLAARPPGVRLATPGDTALVVEDDDRVRAITVRSLEEAGYRVLAAANGEAALGVLSGTERLDVLVTDLAMPRMDGRALATRLLAARPEVPVLFMSGYTDDEVIHQGLLAEGQPFIQKPFTPLALAERVHEVIAARRGGHAVDGGPSAR
jgi:CheY-like chemotaxis protein